MSKSIFIRVFLSVWVVYLIHFNPSATGSDRFVYLTRSIVEDRSVNIDPFREKTGDQLAGLGNHSYIVANPGLSMLAAPAWMLVDVVYGRWPASSPIREEAVHFLLAHAVGFASTTAPLSALTAMGLAWLVWRRTGERWRALLTASVYAFGSMAFYYSTRMQQNVAIASVAFGVFVLLYEPFGIFQRRPIVRTTTIGALLSLGALIDLSILPLALCVALPLLRQTRGVSGWAALALASALPMAVLGAYQYHAFGSPLFPAQAYLVNVPTSYHTQGWLGVTVPRAYRLVDYLVTARQGLFIYMPFTALALWYSLTRSEAVESLRRPEKQMLYWIIGAYLVYVGLLQASESLLFGPRYLMPIVPFFCLLLGLYLPARASAVSVALIGWGFLANTAGAEIGAGTGNLFHTTAAWLLRGPWLPILNWTEEHLKGNPQFHLEHLSPYGLLIAMTGLLALIWWPLLRRSAPSA